MAYGNLLADVVQGSTANTPPVFKDGNGTTIGTLCRAWVIFTGTGTVAITSSFNVSSITDNGTGNYTINFTTALPDANYAATSFATINNTTDPCLVVSAVNNATKTASALQIGTVQTNTAARQDAFNVSMAIFR